MREISFSQRVVKKQSLDSVSSAVLKTLLYFDIFYHPLTAEEIFSFLSSAHATKYETEQAFARLLRSGMIRTMGNYFFVSSDPSLIQRRRAGEIAAVNALRKAEKYSRIIASFPFVRGVFISGSLSKGYMDKESDIDYFIVTEPERLWLSRMLLVLFKRIFLFNSHKYFCVNYFVSTDGLSIPDRNVFTATELVSVIPTYNYLLYEKFLEQNPWTQDFLPNAIQRDDKYCVSRSKFVPKRILERIFSGKAGNHLDELCFRITLKYWKRKFSHFDANEFDHKLRSRKNVSKHHPLGYQQKVLKAFEEKLRWFETKYGVDLS
jgi:hypothetical protein